MPHATERENHLLERMVFFSDAVFAIAITLLVIDIHVPDRLPSAESAGLWNALTSTLPQLLGFLISFSVIGRFWASHHTVFGLVTRSDRALLRSNMVFLFTMALMPFPTAIISRYGGLGAAQQIYAALLFVAALAQARLIGRALRPGCYRADDVSQDEADRLIRRAWAVPVAPAMTFLIATFYPTPLTLLSLILMPLAIALADKHGRRLRHRAGSSR